MSKLSFLLPQYDSAIDKLYDEVSYTLHMKDKILQLFPPLEVAHNGSTRIVSKPNLLDMSPRLHKTEIKADINMVLQTDAIKFKDFVIRMITSLQDQLRIQTLEVIDQTSQATGNNIEGKDRNIWDSYIEMLEKLDFGFDENGKPLYTPYVSSETFKKITVLPTEEQLRKMKEIINIKREKYFAKKRSRKLY